MPQELHEQLKPHVEKLTAQFIAYFLAGDFAGADSKLHSIESINRSLGVISQVVKGA
jgi:hypothetical protein